MATYIGAAVAEGNSTTPAVTLNHSAGDNICSVFIVHTSKEPASVTFDGSGTGVVLAHSEITQTDFRVYIYVKFGVLAGSHTWSSTITSSAWLAECVQANNATWIKSVTQSTSASSTGWSLTVNPLATGDLLLGGDTWEYGHGAHATTAGTQIVNDVQGTVLGAGAAYIVGNDGSRSLSWTSAGATPYCAAGIVLTMGGGQVMIWSNE